MAKQRAADRAAQALQPERVVVVGVQLPGRTDYSVDEYLDELVFLVETAGGQVIARYTQRLATPETRSYIGRGKAEEIGQAVKAMEIDLVVFDDELTPSQQRNLEQEFGCRVVDRTNLILDIFAQRARTAHAKRQVALAQYQYLLPRLTGMWTHLERQRGGIGMRGPGEREIETDRRIIRERIAQLKEELKLIDRQMATQRKGRKQQVRVALVGYTNVGKSTLMNLLTNADVFAENKLFATLDTTVRKVSWPECHFLLSDTVGFIRKLPPQLVESFKSTLDEVREADLLVHVVDVSHPRFEQQLATVNETLRDLKAIGKEQILLFNKIDAYTPVLLEEDDLQPRGPEHSTLQELEQTWMHRDQTCTVFLSARTGENVDQFRELLRGKVLALQAVRYPWMQAPNTPS